MCFLIFHVVFSTCQYQFQLLANSYIYKKFWKFYSVASQFYQISFTCVSNLHNLHHSLVSNAKFKKQTSENSRITNGNVCWNESSIYSLQLLICMFLPLVLVSLWNESSIYPLQMFFICLHWIILFMNLLTCTCNITIIMHCINVLVVYCLHHVLLIIWEPYVVIAKEQNWALKWVNLVWI